MSQILAVGIYNNSTTISANARVKFSAKYLLIKPVLT
jgi:hypothetical protein